MKRLSLIACIGFSLIAMICMMVAISKNSLSYAMLSGICGGVSYIAFTDFMKAKKKDNIFDKKFIK